MSSAKLILLAFQASLALTVFAASLDARPGDATYLVRHPGLLARTILSMNIVMPMLALWMALVFSLHPAVKAALIALAMSPVPPFLPARMMKAGNDAYAISLLVTASLLSVVTIPATLWAFSWLLGTPFEYSHATLLKMMAAGILIPVAVALLIRRHAPAVADRLGKPVAVTAGLALIVAAIPLFGHVWPAMKTLLGNGTLLAILALAIAGLAVGHFLGGPGRDDQPVLALATASRHPAVAMTIAQAMFPNQSSVGAAVLLDIIVVALIASPYVSWATRQAAAHAKPPENLHDEPRRPAHGHAGENAGGSHFVGRRQDRRE